MRIFLVNLVVNSPQYCGYNFGLGYIASVLKNEGHNIDYILLKNRRDIFSLYKKVKNVKPKIVAFSVTSSQFNYLKNITKTIKKVSKTFILCGGVHPTLKPNCIFEIPELDAIVIGEGEFPLLELANAVQKNIEYRKTKNFWFRDKDKIIENEVRPLIINLDELPFPDKESLDYQRVIDTAGGKNRFIFSRGCPFQCTYCCNKALSKIYPNSRNYFRQRSPQKAIEEIEMDEKKFKFNEIIFDDDIISLNKKWFYNFFNLYKKKFNYPFRCNIRVGTIDSDMMKLLKEAGAIMIRIGIEHGNEEFRKTILKRNISNKQIINTFKLCDKYKIRHNDFMIVGFPFETKKLFLDTVKLCREVSAKGQINIFHPYPGTDLDIVCEKNKWIPDKKYFMEREEAVISFPNYTKKEIQLCHDVFQYLIKFKFIPLNIPLKLVLYIFRFSHLIKSSILFVPRKLKNAR